VRAATWYLLTWPDDLTTATRLYADVIRAAVANPQLEQEFVQATANMVGVYGRSGDLAQARQLHQQVEQLAGTEDKYLPSLASSLFNLLEALISAQQLNQFKHDAQDWLALRNQLADHDARRRGDERMQVLWAQYHLSRIKMTVAKGFPGTQDALIDEYEEIAKIARELIGKNRRVLEFLGKCSEHNC
jgi:hypothetical protein